MKKWLYTDGIYYDADLDDMGVKNYEHKELVIDIDEVVMISNNGATLPDGNEIGCQVQLKNGDQYVINEPFYKVKALICENIINIK